MSTRDAWSDLSEGWTEVPLPPDVRDGAAFAWTGSELLAWGGCDPAAEDDCDRTADGFAFDPATRTWGSLPEAPVAGAYAHGVWTGNEAIFLGLADEERLDGQAYDPATGTWRTIAPAPLRPRWGGVRVWTGSELIVWGGGQRGGPAPQNGAAYNPATDTWRRIAEAPHGLNLASGMWTGTEMLVFGSLLNGKNWADTPTSEGAAYDPTTDAWRELPPSALSPQATSAVWVGDRMVAWDYEVHSQEYDPVRDAWSAPVKMPLAFSECYPDSVVVRDLIFAFFCGRAALYDVRTHAWLEIHGGMLEEEIWSDAYQRSLKLWRFADVVPAGDAVLLPAEGLTLNRKGTACYGCSGAPVSFWAYKPPTSVALQVPVERPASRHAVRGVAADFMYARTSGSEGLISWLVTARAAAMFGDETGRVAEPLFTGKWYRIVGVRSVEGRPGIFAVRVRLQLQGGARLNETLIVGPGRSVGGERLPLVVIGVRRGSA
ncbi:MAG: hypothetical protein HYU54_04485 [Actinobacteria bacterium]|nr:hypothetical protein [Actinomycetota bacterium]